MDLVVFSWIFRGNGGCFVDFSWEWWFFRGFFMGMVVFSLICLGSGGFFMDF